MRRRHVAMTAAPLTLDSRIRLHDLQSRPEGDEWIVGRVLTGEFVSLPAEAMTFLGELRRGGTVAEAQRRTSAVHGEDVDALDFVDTLIELGFVASVDDAATDQETPRPPSLSWLRSGHVAWLFRPPALVVTGGFIGAGIAVMAYHGWFPGYSDFFALHDPGLNLLLAVAVTMTIVGLHEFCHLAAARAAGINGWLGWGTRLFFLVAQTTVPGLWLAPRRIRLRVFLAGMICDLAVCSAGVIGMTWAAPGGVIRRVLAQVCLICLLGIVDQFAFFTRTDIYFVIQELAGCKNLFADASGYLCYLLSKLSARGQAVGWPNPLPALPPSERLPVRLYAGLVAAGSGWAVVVFAWYGLPVIVGTYVRAVRELAEGLARSQPGPIADAVGVIAATLPFQLLFVRTFLRTHTGWLTGRPAGGTLRAGLRARAGRRG
jgi:putative peptide zinc metalloprotease protein